MKELLKKTIFYKWYRKLVELKEANETRKNLSSNTDDYYCVGCHNYWKSFKPFSATWFKILKKAGWSYELHQAETLNYKNYNCYGCNINDRDRIYLLYLEKVLKKDEQYNVVDFAPTPVLREYFKKYKNITHRTCDLFMENVDDNLDIQNLSSYKDEQFDIFVCSHILEHVDDDIKAMKELYRITKKGGWGITMVPIMDGLKETHEDISIKDPVTRMKYFGQEDHVRLYAKDDFIKRLESVGFTVKLLGADYFGKEVFDKNAITQKSLLYISEKN